LRRILIILHHWLIGASSGGVWETHDAGISWAPRTDYEDSLWMGAIAFSSSDPLIAYAGTGEPIGDAGIGLLKSTDGGTSWNLVPNTPFAQTSFSEIKVSPDNSDIIVAATTWGKEGGRYGKVHDTPETGVYISSDGGTTWSLTLEGSVTDLEIDPNNFSNQYAALGYPKGYENIGLFRSTNEGMQWEPITIDSTLKEESIGRIKLAISPANPDVLYVAIHNAQDENNALLGLWRTDNAWETKAEFTQVKDNNGTVLCNKDCHYNLEIIVDPQDENILYGGGVDLWRCDDCSGNLAEWTNIRGVEIHNSLHSMAWTGQRLIVGTDGGVYSTTDKGAHWSHHNTNLSLTQFYSGSAYSTDQTEFLLGGTHNNGTLKYIDTSTDVNPGEITCNESYVNENHWNIIYDGSGFDNAIATQDYSYDTHWAISTNKGIYKATDGINFKEVRKGGELFEKCPKNDDVFITEDYDRTNPGDNKKYLFRTEKFFTTSPWLPKSTGYEDIAAMAFFPGESDNSCNIYAFSTNKDILLTNLDFGQM
jgi:photosystem II stability/assembly factor-like uncharacterized protein